MVQTLTRFAFHGQLLKVADVLECELQDEQLQLLMAQSQVDSLNVNIGAVSNEIDSLTYTYTQQQSESTRYQSACIQEDGQLQKMPKDDPNRPPLEKQDATDHQELTWLQAQLLQDQAQLAQLNGRMQTLRTQSMQAATQVSMLQAQIADLESRIAKES